MEVKYKSEANDLPEVSEWSMLVKLPTEGVCFGQR